MTGPLLVVAHEATRTGSPRVLLDLLRHVVPCLEVPVAVRLLAGGPLAGDLTALATAPDDHHRPAAVWVNGALAAGEVAALPGDVPSLIYVHEEGEALDVLAAEAREALVGRFDRVLCVSERSATGLVALGVDRDRIVVVPPVIGEAPPPEPAAIAAARDAFGASDAPLIVGCGEAGWRKGADLFVQVAARVAASPAAGAPVQAGWVGRRGRSFGRILDHDTAAVGLTDRLRWLDEASDPRAALAAADVLVMTSREDPQPLVPLEAALVGTPTVGFAVGGLLDYAAAGAARVVPYPDVAALADAVLGVLADPATARALADAGARHAREERSVEVLGPRVLDEVRRVLTGGGR